MADKLLQIVPEDKFDLGTNLNVYIKGVETKYDFASKKASAQLILQKKLAVKAAEAASFMDDFLEESALDQGDDNASKKIVIWGFDANEGGKGQDKPTGLEVMGRLKTLKANLSHIMLAYMTEAAVKKAFSGVFEGTDIGPATKAEEAMEALLDNGNCAIISHNFFRALKDTLESAGILGSNDDSLLVAVTLIRPYSSAKTQNMNFPRNKHLDSDPYWLPMEVYRQNPEKLGITAYSVRNNLHLPLDGPGRDAAETARQAEEAVVETYSDTSISEVFPAD